MNGVFSLQCGTTLRCATRCGAALRYATLRDATLTLRYAASIGVKEQQESKSSNEADNGGDSEGLTSIWGS